MITAATTNAEWMPAAVASTRDAPAPATAAPCAVITVTKSAVPAVPATCCTVPTSALPCEYRCGGSDPRDAVSTGVNTSVSPPPSTTWATSTGVGELVAPSDASAHAEALTTTVPGTSSRPLPSASSPRTSCA